MPTEEKIVIKVGRLDLRVVSHFESTCPNCQGTIAFGENPHLTGVDHLHCPHCSAIIRLDNE